jgi:hypothetical protein
VEIHDGFEFYSGDELDEIERELLARGAVQIAGTPSRAAVAEPTTLRAPRETSVDSEAPHVLPPPFTPPATTVAKSKAPSSKREPSTMQLFHAVQAERARERLADAIQRARAGELDPDEEQEILEEAEALIARTARRQTT